VVASDHGSGVLTPLAWPTLAGGVLLILLSLVDLVANIWPLQFGQLEWRYGAWGLLSAYLLTPLLGTILLAAAAALLGHNRALSVLSWLNLTAAGLLVVGSVLFVLDVVQLRGAVPLGDQSRFDTGAAKALIKYFAVGGVLAWLGFACRSAARQATASRARRGDSGVLVG